MVTTQVWEVEIVFVALLGQRQRSRPGSCWDAGLSLGHVNSKVPSGFVLLGTRLQLGVWRVNTKRQHNLKAAGRKLVEMESMNAESTWDDRIRNTGAHVTGGRKRGGGTVPGLEERTDGVRLVANAGVRIFPAEQGCSHFPPRKPTVEPKATFPL